MVIPIFMWIQRAFFQYGKENEIKVIARNADQPNSRWYSGTGIYRPAYLYVGEEKHIPVNGVKIRTLSYDPARIEVVVKTSSPGEVSLKIEFEGSKVLRVIGESTKIGNVNNDKIISSDNKNMQPNESVQTGKNGQKSELAQVEAEKNNQAAAYQAIFSWMFQTQSSGIQSTRISIPVKQFSAKTK